MGCSSFTRAWTFSDFRGLNEAGREFIDTGFPRTVRVPVADPSAAKTPSGRRLRSKLVMSWKRTYPVRRTLRVVNPEKAQAKRCCLPSGSLPKPRGVCENLHGFTLQGFAFVLPSCVCEHHRGSIALDDVGGRGPRSRISVPGATKSTSSTFRTQQLSESALNRRENPAARKKDCLESMHRLSLWFNSWATMVSTRSQTCIVRGFPGCWIPSPKRP